MDVPTTRYELEERERLFHTVFENSPDAIFIEDMQGNVLDVNPADVSSMGSPASS